MVYCEFENTLAALWQCYESLQLKPFSELSFTEKGARNDLVELCKSIAKQFEKELEKE